jgi:hypothetical protein
VTIKSEREWSALVRVHADAYLWENTMNRKIVLIGLAALTLAANAAPASAQARRGSDIYISGPSDYGGWYGDYAYSGPGVSVGLGAPAWSYNNWGYGDYAAAPCACATPDRSARIAPRYRSSSWGGYSSDYASYPYDDYYYGGTYDRSRMSGDAFVAQSRTTVRGGDDTRGSTRSEFRAGTGEPSGRGGRRGDSR